MSRTESSCKKIRYAGEGSAHTQNNTRPEGGAYYALKKSSLGRTAAALLLEEGRPGAGRVPADRRPHPWLEGRDREIIPLYSFYVPNILDQRCTEGIHNVDRTRTKHKQLVTDADTSWLYMQTAL